MKLERTITALAGAADGTAPATAVPPGTPGAVDVPMIITEVEENLFLFQATCGQSCQEFKHRIGTGDGFVGAYDLATLQAEIDERAQHFANCIAHRERLRTLKDQLK